MLGVVLLVMLGPSNDAADGGTHQMQLPQVLVTYAQPSAAFTPLFLGIDHGVFARYGLDVRIEQANGPAAVAALTSGEAQVFMGGAEVVTNADLAGASVVMLAAASNYPVFSLYVGRSVTRPEDLIGKRIGVTRLGTSTDMTARMILAHYHLQDKVTVMGTGGTMPELVAAVKQGVVAGGIVSPPTTAIMAAEGFRELVNGVTLGEPMTQSAVATTRAYLAAHRTHVVNFMKGFLAAWAFTRDPVNKPAVVKVIAQHTGVDEKKAEVGYDAFFPIWAKTRVPTVDPAGVANVLKFVKNRAKTGRPGQFIDNSVLDELRQSGFIASLYK